MNFDERDGFGISVSTSIPLAFKYKYDAGVGEATANVQTGQDELWRLRVLALFEVKQALVEAQTALEQRNLFLHTHIPQAEHALQASQSATRPAPSISSRSSTACGPLSRFILSTSWPRQILSGPGQSWSGP